MTTVIRGRGQRCRVLDGLDHLPDDPRGVPLCKVALVHNAVEEFAAFDVIKHQVQVLWRIKVFLHPDKVCVICLPKDSQLHVNHVLLAGAERFVDDLDGILLAVGP